MAKSQKFNLSPLSFFWNPLYIIRSNLFSKIKKNSSWIYGKVLDFGCGTKPYRSLFNNLKMYVGIDLKKTASIDAITSIDVFYDGRRIPFKNNSFDSIVCFEVIEHVFNINIVLQEWQRVLKPEGHVLLSIPFAWEEHEAPFDFARYTSFGIMHLLQENNFRVIKIEKTTTTISAIISMLNHYSTRISGKNIIAKTLVRCLLVGPLNLLSFILNKILPIDTCFYCNLVVLCKKNA